MEFRDQNSVGIGNVSTFNVSSADGSTIVWDVTDPTNVKQVLGNLNGSTFSFTTQTEALKEFVGFKSSATFATPSIPENAVVGNQDLHASGQPDLVIVTHPTFKSAANRLALQRREQCGSGIVVVEIEHVFNEFSSGTKDVSAIRDYMKMLYDRAAGDVSKMPRYLLLMGDGSYDPNSTTDNFIPTYQSPNSVSPTQSFTSDDYFGILDDNEGGSIIDAANPDYIDVAIGRIPAKNASEANAYIDKIINYESRNSHGSWRNTITFIGDDEDNNTHFNQALGLAEYVESNYPVYNVDKIFLDAYEQVSTPGGSRYPDVKDAINRRIFSGTLILNYTGHGGINGWAHERIVDVNDVLSWENIDKLPVFVTATCSFSKYDDPAIVSAGEHCLLNPNGGAIALITTVRLVYSGDNATLNSSFLKKLYEFYESERPPIGKVLMETKNSVLSSTSDINSRKFLLLGDPSMSMAYPQENVFTTHVNNIDVTTGTDTLKALSKVSIRGDVKDDDGAKLTNFNGVVYPTIYDKAELISTLKNDPGSNQAQFDLQRNIIYRGKASVTNGEFEFEFVVPKDISYNFGTGKISYYASDNTVDANGFNNDVIIGGTAENYNTDEIGPQISVFMNDEKFAFGGMTDENPILLVKLQDENGINTVGNGIGHDLTAVLDDETNNTLVLNEYYEADLDQYKSGEVRYPLSEMEAGRHRVTVKAWDVYNNSSDAYTEFVVAESAQLALSHVLNYPNPFTTNTSFHFEHNRPGDALYTQVQVFTVSGKLLKTIERNTISEGYRVDDISWDGLDDYGDPIGRGVYVYKVKVKSSLGEAAHKFEKLVILR